MEPPATFPRTVDEIFDDFCQRRYGLQRALTDDADALYAQCDPRRENLCVYGDRRGGWSVAPPVEEVPAELPEPCLGINFARDGMPRQEWLSLVAAHADAWLVAVAFFYGVKLDAGGRARLHRQINALPTLFEVVARRARPTPRPVRKAASGGADGVNGPAATAGGGGSAAPAAAPGRLGPRLPPVPFAEMPASAGGSQHPDPRGRRLVHGDITPRLQGKFAEVRFFCCRTGRAYRICHVCVRRVLWTCTHTHKHTHTHLHQHTNQPTTTLNTQPPHHTALLARRRAVVPRLHRPRRRAQQDGQVRAL